MATLMEARTRESVERAMARGREQAFEEMERALQESRGGKEVATLMEARTRESVERAMARGRAEERALLLRLAERRFGAEAAAELSELVEKAEGAEDSTRAGDRRQP